MLTLKRSGSSFKVLHQTAVIRIYLKITVKKKKITQPPPNDLPQYGQADTHTHTHTYCPIRNEISFVNLFHSTQEM